MANSLFAFPSIIGGKKEKEIFIYPGVLSYPMTNNTWLVRNTDVNWQVIRRIRLWYGLLYFRKQKAMEIYKLNEPSIYVWDSLERDTKENVIKLLVSELDISENKLRSFIQTLLDKNFISEVSKKPTHQVFRKKHKIYSKKRSLNLKLKDSIPISSANDWYAYKLLDYMRKTKVYFPFYYPKKVYFDITYRCNLSCTYCYVKNNDPEWVKRMAKQEMSLSEIKKALDTFAANHVDLVILIGGEPCVRKDLPEIIEHAHKIGIELNINTNGTIAPKKLFDTLKKYKQNMRVTLDGPTAEVNDELRGKGTYEKVIKNIKALQENGVPVDLNFVVTKQNVKHLPEMYRLSRKLKVNNFSLVPYTRISENQEEIKNTELTPLNDIYVRLFSILHYLRKRPKFHLQICEYFSVCSVDIKGQMHLCPHIPRINPFGHIFKDSFMQMWHGSKHSIVYDKDKKEAPCSTCVYVDYCQTGCPAELYAHEGTFTAGAKFCTKRKLFVPFDIFRKILYRKTK